MRQVRAEDDDMKTETKHQRYYRKHGDRVRARSRRWARANPKRVAYNHQRVKSKFRGIPFLLTLDQWIEWWGDDFAKRGTVGDGLVMARLGDTGPYSLDNIEKITHEQNVKDQIANRQGSPLLSKKKAMPSSRGEGREIYPTDETIWSEGVENG